MHFPKGAKMGLVQEAYDFFHRMGGDGELMRAVFGLGDGQVVECDDGPKCVERQCRKCGNEFLVSAKHAAEIEPDNPFNICTGCLDEISAIVESGQPLPNDVVAYGKQMMQSLK